MNSQTKIMIVLLVIVLLLGGVLLLKITGVIDYSKNEMTAKEIIAQRSLAGFFGNAGESQCTSIDT